MAATLRNAVKRKTHKERAQPAARRSRGLLEKHKDYVERAQNFHKKQETLQTLHQKAEARNPDEFYFAMENATTRGGVHVQSSTRPNKYSQDELRLMKSQDASYLQLKAQTESKRLARQRQGLHFLGVPAKNIHTVFVDDESDLNDFSPAQYFDTPEQLVERRFNRPRNAEVDLPHQAVERGKALSKLERRRSASYKEMSQRRERQAKLRDLYLQKVQERHIMGRGRKRKLKAHETGGQSSVFLWKKERKK